MEGAVRSGLNAVRVLRQELAAPGRAGLVAGPGGPLGSVNGSGPVDWSVPAEGSAGTGATA
jgi:hypothetical protein